MNPSDQGVERKRNDRRTKAQLQQALVDAKRILDEQVKELAARDRDLEKARAEIADLKEQSKEPHSLDVETNVQLRETEHREQVSEERSSEQKERVKEPTEKLDAVPPSDELLQGEAPPSVTLRADASSRKGPAPRPEAVTVLGGIPSLCDFAIVQAGGPGHKGLVRCHQAFEVHLTVDPADLISERGARAKYNVSTYAKRLEDGQRQFIGEVSGDIASPEVFTATVASAPLPLGTYRLEATASFVSTAGDPKQIRTLSRNCLIHVY